MFPGLQLGRLGDGFRVQLGVRTLARVARSGGTILRTLSIPGFTSGVHAHVVFRKGAEKLLDGFEKASFHVDIALSLERGNLRVFSANPPIVFQDQSVSVSQIAAKAPYLLNTLFDRISMNEQGTTFAYMMYEPAGRVPLIDYPINGHAIAFCMIFVILYHVYPRGLIYLLIMSLLDAVLDIRNGTKPSSFATCNLCACMAGLIWKELPL